MIWMALGMAVMGVGGFFLAEDVFAKKLLHDSKVQRDRLHPVRILTPQEAEKLSSDQTSHVWTEGVRDSDVPNVAPSYTPMDDSSTHSRKHRRAHSPKPRTPGKRATVDTPSDTPTEITTDAPQDTPSGGGGTGDTGNTTPDTTPPAPANP